MALSDDKLGKLVREHATAHAELVHLIAELAESGEQWQRIGGDLMRDPTATDTISLETMKTPEEIAADLARYNDLFGRIKDYERRLTASGYSHISFPAFADRPSYENDARLPL